MRELDEKERGNLHLGGNVRFALLKQNILMPDVSVGFGYNRMTGSISMPLDVPTQTFTFSDGTANHTLEVTQPNLALDWTTDSFDFTLHVSKSFLFLRPYAGAGYSLGKSTVNGGLKAAMEYDGEPVTEFEVEQMKTDLAAAGITVPELDTTGFKFGSENTDPVLRLYGGLSFDLFMLMLDTQVSYVPKTRSLGLTGMIRIQL